MTCRMRRQENRENLEQQVRSNSIYLSHYNVLKILVLFRLSWVIKGWWHVNQLRFVHLFTVGKSAVHFLDLSYNLLRDWFTCHHPLITQLNLDCFFVKVKKRWIFCTFYFILPIDITLLPTQSICTANQTPINFSIQIASRIENPRKACVT